MSTSTMSTPPDKTSRRGWEFGCVCACFPCSSSRTSSSSGCCSLIGIQQASCSVLWPPWNPTPAAGPRRWIHVGMTRLLSPSSLWHGIHTPCWGGWHRNSASWEAPEVPADGQQPLRCHQGVCRWGNSRHRLRSHAVRRDERAFRILACPRIPGPSSVRWLLCNDGLLVTLLVDFVGTQYYERKQGLNRTSEEQGGLGRWTGEGG
ncbi:hypothetical protein MLD38_014187 [Melastoma candidum]|uniref:Uncharacterized protein n=1 Tax=Melastoma candidum TaxID=119954 RepID=A0ACB9RC34_9MYRT|nr:hypothetical protein MLD38_014187 [Melastoma candidum]